MKDFPGKVLLATDGLESTALASRAAVDIAKGGGADLHVVHVWRPVASPHYDRSLRDAGRETLDDQVRRIEEAGGTVAGAHLREGQIDEEVVAQAEEIGTVIVVGGHTKGAPGR